MRNSSSLRSARKGQFFILTTVVVVTILFFISRWIGPPAQVDTSDIVQMEELFTFDNIREKTTEVVKYSENCDDLNYNLQEYKNFLDEYGKEKNYRIDFSYSPSPCFEEFGAVVYFSLKITSNKVNAESSFSVTWP
ncbi:MAG: hypothetical protein QW818_03435 [Candidatus Aenigmatarchaeota archaeon]